MMNRTLHGGSRQGLLFIGKGIMLMPKVLYIGDSETVIRRYCNQKG
jgi:hypothetical protein